MARIKPKHVLKAKREGRFLGVSLFVLAVATGSAAVYECSPTTPLPLLPSDTTPQQSSQPQSSSNPQPSPPNDPPQTTPSDPTPTDPQPTPTDPQQPSPTAPSQVQDRNDLTSMRVTRLQIGSQSIYAWIAETAQQQEYGLMSVQPSEMADNQGMLFVFPQSQLDGFWMKNTLIPLDIAFIRDDGMVVDIQQMAPQSLILHQPSISYRYALEVNAGVCSQIGLQPGQVIRIPADVLNP